MKPELKEQCRQAASRLGYRLRESPGAGGNTLLRADPYSTAEDAPFHLISFWAKDPIAELEAYISILTVLE